jgi:putative hemolysin
MPPLLKICLRAGARVGGEPCWNPALRCADVFVLLRDDRVTPRWRRRFVNAGGWRAAR